MRLTGQPRTHSGCVPVAGPRNRPDRRPGLPGCRSTSFISHLHIALVSCSFKVIIQATSEAEGSLLLEGLWADASSVLVLCLREVPSQIAQVAPVHATSLATLATASTTASTELVHHVLFSLTLDKRLQMQGAIHC